MSKTALIVTGVVLTVLGLIFALQGLNYLGGSAMSGKTLWAVLGPIIAIVGVILIVIGVRGRART